MQRHAFVENFRAAALAARDFARKFIEEALPDEMLFRVRLNSSYDRNPLRPDEEVYPHDSALEHARNFCECTHEQVTTLLWRKGTVPEWINVSVTGTNRNSHSA
jgi:hypothetical protein